MTIEWFEGICMMCFKTTEVRHVNLYPSGSEGLFCCKDCENKILEFIREIRGESIVKKKEEIRKKKGRNIRKIRIDITEAVLAAFVVVMAIIAGHIF